jgi:hypothetical protein
MTPQEIEDFQANHRDWEGKALVVDGDLGPRTEWALAMSYLDPRRQAIVERACRYVGYTESSPNRAPLIDDWNKRAGQALGSPWCAAFASWCISVEGAPEVREGSAQHLGRSLRNTTLILPGDLMWFPTGSATGHCGIVIGLGPGEVACVEGNHGDGVRLARRSTAQVRLATPLPVQVYPAMPPGLPFVPVSIEGTR